MSIFHLEVAKPNCYLAELHCTNCQAAGMYNIEKGKTVKDATKTLTCKNCKCVGTLDTPGKTYY